MFASDSVLILSAWTDTRVGFAVCLALLGVSERRWAQRKIVKTGVLVAASVWAWGSFNVADPLPRLVLLSWLFAALHVGVERPTVRGLRPEGSSRYLVFHLASLSYAVALAVYNRSDDVWFLIRRVLGHSALLGDPTGAWASGFPIYFLGLLVLLWASALRPRGKRHGVSFLTALGLLPAGFIASRIVLDRLQQAGSLEVSLGQAASLGVVALALSLPDSPGARESRQSDGKGRSGISLTARLGRGKGGVPVVSPLLAVSLAVSAVLAVASVACVRCGCISSPGGADSSWPRSCGPGSSRPTSFAVYSSGMLDWAVPDSSHVGLLNSGMFGLLRRSLERRALQTGGQVTMFDSAAGSITPETLDGAAIIIFINPTAVPCEATLCAIEDFVCSGGGLLVLGDHTNISGSLEPLNAILSFSDIRFNFDSAVPLRQHWLGCLEVRRHSAAGAVAGAAVCGVARDPNLCLQIAVGASLDIKRPAFPVIVGRYGFADAGDPLNGGSQAFIGNLKHDRGERSGDLVLVAAERVGSGRVLVFGDTSPFQNGALFLSQRLVSAVVHWLVGDDGCEGVARDLAFSDEHAVVDFSSRPRASASLFSEASLGGLANCLARDGIASRPAFSPAEWTPDDSFLFLTSPTSLGASEVGRLLGYMDRGGNVIIAQGYADPQPCEALLRAVNLDIQDIPLGSGDAGSRIAHKEAYAIGFRTGGNGLPGSTGGDGQRCVAGVGGGVGGSCQSGDREDGRTGCGVGDVPVGCKGNGAGTDGAGAGCESRVASGLVGDATVLARAFGHPTVVVRRYGRGALTLVSDGRFFLDANLEGERTANSRNIAFVHELVDLLRKEAARETPCRDGRHTLTRRLW